MKDKTEDGPDKPAYCPWCQAYLYDGEPPFGYHWEPADDRYTAQCWCCGRNIEVIVTEED